jgi:hypothetical protein
LWFNLLEVFTGVNNINYVFSAQQHCIFGIPYSRQIRLTLTPGRLWRCRRQANFGAARHLYEKEGFKLVEEHRGTQWGTAVNEQRFKCCLSGLA